MDDILSDIEDYNKKRKRKILIIFDDMISHVMSDRRDQQILKDLFIISLSRHEQVCSMRLRFERYFSHHRAM